MPLIHNDTQKLVLREINTEAIERFLSFCKRTKYRKKSIVTRDHEPADKLYYLIKGSVSVLSEDEEGDEVVLAYVNEGSFLGELGLFYDKPNRSATVRTRMDCEIAEISYKKLEELASTELKDVYAHILFAIGSQLSSRLVKTSLRVTRLASMDVGNRIARTLLDMCDEPDALSHPEGTQIRISRQELARIVGCSREVVGRVLKQMKEDGMIDVDGMNIVVFHSR